MTVDTPPSAGGSPLTQLGVGGLLVAILFSAFGLRTSTPIGDKPVSSAASVSSVPLANSVDPPRELLVRFF